MKSVDLTKIKEPDSSSTESISTKNQSVIHEIPMRRKLIRPVKSTELITRPLNELTADHKHKYFSFILNFVEAVLYSFSKNSDELFTKSYGSIENAMMSPQASLLNSLIYKTDNSAKIA